MIKLIDILSEIKVNQPGPKKLKIIYHNDTRTGKLLHKLNTLVENATSGDKTKDVNLFSTTEDSNHTNDINFFLSLEDNYNVNKFENSHYGVNGNLTFDNSLFTYVSLALKDINELDSVGEKMFHLDVDKNPFIKNSLIFDPNNTSVRKNLSIHMTEGIGDTLEGSKLGLSGFVQRGLINTTFDGSWRAGINFGSSGTTAAMWSGSNNTLAKAYWDLCNGYIGNYGTNDLAGGGTLTNLQTLMQGLWTDVRAAGITTLLQCHLMPRTNSTDSWATAGANQTGVNAAFDSGGLAQQFNTWLGTQISGSGITAELALDTLRDVTNPEDWVVTGAANYATADGVHPSAGSI